MLAKNLTNDMHARVWVSTTNNLLLSYRKNLFISSSTRTPLCTEANFVWKLTMKSYTLENNII